MQRKRLVLVSLTVLAVAACESGGRAGGQPASTTATRASTPVGSTSQTPPGAVSPWVGFANGKLVYGHDTDGNRVPDFSYAGYGGGGAALPDVPDGAAFANDPSYHDNGYFSSQLVGVGAVEDGWVRDVIGQHYDSTFDVGGASTRITVADTASIDMIIPQDIHAQPVAYTLSGQRALVRNCEITGSTLHAWATQSRVAGPNVFSSCTATNTGSRLLDAGPHQRWASGTLYENLMMKGNGQLKLVDRGNLGSGQGWAGANSVLWNCVADGYVVENPPTAYNWAIGCTGKRLDSPKPPGEYESPDKAVEPHSLYAQQFAERPH